MSACKGNGEQPPTTDPVTEESTVGNGNGTPSGDVKPLNDSLVSANFEGMEDMDHGDASFCFIDEGATRVLKQERIAFAENDIPSNNGQKWDGATGSWVKASDIKTGGRMYTIDFSEQFSEGSLVISFQFKRGGGAKQSFGIKPKGCSRSTTAVIIENESLTVASEEGKVTTASFKDINIPQNEWCFATITYNLILDHLTISAVVTDEYGIPLASVVTQPVKSSAISTVSGIDLLDYPSSNLADYGEDVPLYTTSVWYLKNLKVQANPMKTGDSVKIPSSTVSLNDGTRFNFLSINGEHTFKSYFGRYNLLPDGSGFICGTQDGRFYLYDIEKQTLTYLDVAKPVTSYMLNDVDVYVNPITGNIFYRQLNDAGCNVLYKMNPKTFEKTKLFEATDPKMFVYVEVTNDERYTCYILGSGGGSSGSSGVSAPVGRIDLTTGTVDIVQYITFDRTFGVNHFIINPVYPDLVLFHEGDGVNDDIHEDTNVLNFVTGEIKTYEASSLSAHAMWTHDGENVTVTEYKNGFTLVVLTKDMEKVSTHVINEGNHIMLDASKKWAFGSAKDVGVSVTDLTTGNRYLIRMREGLEYPLNEISYDGKTILWGYVSADGVRGIAWMKNPGIAE